MIDGKTGWEMGGKGLVVKCRRYICGLRPPWHREERKQQKMHKVGRNETPKATNM